MTEPILLTPGPLTTSKETKTAMLRDWGSWDRDFNALTAAVCSELTDILDAAGTHVCVPLPCSGTFAVEAALGTLVPRNGRVLVPDNGAYCRRITRILGYLGRQAVVLDHREDEAIDPVRVEAALAADPTITHVALVHCETGTGILNPLDGIATVVARHDRKLIIDAMSSFAAIRIHARETQFDALIAASGKCLEGVPGMGFVVTRRDALENAAGNSHSLAMDLHDQWVYLQQTGQWRFTPPTHVVAALFSALAQYHQQGGQPARLARYQTNCQTLVSGLRDLGLQTFLSDDLQAPIIVTFHAPGDPAYSFKDLYRRVRDKGFILYPGKLTTIDTFRVGCIGAIDTDTIERAVAAIGEALDEAKVVDLAPRIG